VSETATQDAPAVVDPEPLLRIASGFMAAKHLFAAAELGVFEALADGPATLGELAAPTGLSPEDGEVFSAGVEAITAGSAHALAESGLLAGRRRLLDVGGGTGSFLTAALDRVPGLEGTLVEVEPAASIARDRLAGRAAVVTADALGDPLPEGQDAILVANLAHLFSPAHNRELLARLRAVAAPGARLLLVDFWTDAGHTDPPVAALMAGEFALFSDEGDVYSEDEVREWLAATGWRAVERRALAGPQSVIVAEAR
jgi:3-hydroxy-5-methyl-1-naphthoate 3-O-methyltransferase